MLKKNLLSILKQIENGNNLGEQIQLVGATKTVPVETINEAIGLGLKIVAENRVQEFNSKHGLIFGAEEHFIGHLQTNKVKYLVGKVSLIQSVDSFNLANKIDIQAKKKSTVQDVLIEINVGGELSKSGFFLENINAEIDNISKLENVRIKGLMAMLPKSDDKLYLKSLCVKVRNVFDSLKADYPSFQYLSMGMSGDYQIAIENGSNMIRLGSSIFGARK